MSVQSGNLWDDLATLKSSWRETIEHDGGHCPVCDRWGRIYGRNINETMARSLLWLVNAERDSDGWVDVPKTAPRWLVRSNQLPTLKWWGLVERRGNTEESPNKFSGMWRPTELGCKFAAGQAQVPRKVFTYNNNVEGFGEEKIFIRECMGEIFDYQEVMSLNFKE